MNLNGVIEIDKDSIDKLKFEFPEDNTFWQSAGRVKTILKSGMAEKVYVMPHYDTIIKTNKALIVEKRSIGLGEYGLFVLGLDSDIDDYESSLVALCKREKCLFVQVETLDYDTPYEMDTNFMRKGAYKKFIENYTAVIDLRKSESEILANMKQKGRYNIKLARNKGVEVALVKPDDKHIDEFYKLVEETTERNNFNQANKKYFKKFLKKVAGARLYLAKYEGEIIAGGIFVKSKDSCIYYYGASTSKANYRNLMAPYLLQWTAILDAKKENVRIYDFLGVAKPGTRKSRLSGVTDFKMKLTNDVRLVSDSYIYKNKKIKYYAIALLRFIKSFKK